METENFSDAGPESFEVEMPAEEVIVEDLEIEILDEPEAMVDVGDELPSVDQEQSIIGPEQTELLHTPEKLPEHEPGGQVRPMWSGPPGQGSSTFQPSFDENAMEIDLPTEQEILDLEDSINTLREEQEGEIQEDAEALTNHLSPDYMNVSEGGEVPEEVGEIVTDANVDLEVETAFQIPEAVEAIQEIEGVDPENWQALDTPQRLEVLQEIEDQMADIQDRPPMAVELSEMQANLYGGYDGQKIEVNASHLESDIPVDEHINTIVHEGRHAYQDHRVNRLGNIADTEAAATWAENMDNYLNAEDYGQELYEAQPIEDDASRFANQVTGALIASNLAE